MNRDEQIKRNNMAMDTTKQSILYKLETYTLNPFHLNGRHKAKWFRRALGFTNMNKEQLAEQIVFDHLKATRFGLNRFGIIYNQCATIKGANGRIIDGIRLGWIKERKTGLIRLTNVLPPK
jgi:hypothetical protein